MLGMIQNQNNEIETINLTKQDATFKSYFRDKNHISDMINGTIFKGVQEFRPDDIEIRDTDSSFVYPNKATYVSLNRTRDSLVRCHNDNMTIDIGIEYESTINDNAFLKVSIYNGAHDLICHATKDYAPVLTIILCSTKKRWDKPISIHEMIDDNNAAKSYINDLSFDVYGLNELDINNFKDHDNRELIRINKILCKDKSAWTQDMQFNAKSEVCLLLADIHHLDADFVKAFIKENELGGKINMKTLIEEQMEERENRGRIEGRTIGRSEGKAEGRAETIIELIPAYISDKPSASLIELIMQATSEQLQNLMNFLTSGEIKSEREALAFFHEN